MLKPKVVPSQAQDVWKDAGENVGLVTLALTRQNQSLTQEKFQEFADRSQAIIRSMLVRAPRHHIKVAIGISNTGWDYLFPHSNKPKELETFKGLKNKKFNMPGTPGDIFLHVRADTYADVYEILTQYRLFLQDFTKVLDETKGFRYFEGRAIIGFVDGTEAPEVADAAPYALVGNEDPEFINGYYLLAQKWRHNLDYWNSLTVETQSKAIGRQRISDLELPDDKKFENAHTLAANVDTDDEEKKIIRMNIPYADPAVNINGTFFVGYARYWHITKEMITKMMKLGDYLLTFSDVLTGQVYFIPSRPMLAKMAAGDLK